MTQQINFDKYRKFVDAVTSDESKDFIAFSDRVVSLDEKGANIERLLTGAVGINAEGGEVMEIVKKLMFQGKPWNEETKYHIKKTAFVATGLLLVFPLFTYPKLCTNIFMPRLLL